ncbi:MAG: hypothetical protein C0399_11740 [Syntrophus sp. (in: bacteria)]|nr:hypothetical protein [Syntrophus sp. (in: bacteria)]
MDKWQVYTQEAQTQIEFAKSSWAAFLEAERQRNLFFDIFLHLQHFLSHAAIVDKILDPIKSSERYRLLEGHIDLSGVDLKPFRRLRNNLEHFDERLDRWVSEYDGYPFFDMNLVTGTKGFPKKAYLRALDGHIYKFHGEDYDLDQLYATIVAIGERLENGKYNG